MQWFLRLFERRKQARNNRPVQVFFTNTLTGAKEVFIPQKAGLVTMYTCGPTVYGPAHIGNMRAYIFSDTIVRTLTAAGYPVRRVINITDFGHLTSDADEGEDKMVKGLKREGLELTLENMRAMAEKYATQFIAELEELNVDTAAVTFPRASDYIPEQIALISTLEQKGYAYKISDGVYFDTAQFPRYGVLGGIDVSQQQEGTRVAVNKEKRNPADFTLWKNDPKMGWESPWGRGFPGWHIECSAMSRALLGQEIDIHTGGQDHIAVHHNNEIAQSEAASGRTFAHYWMHSAFLTMNGEKASKSLGNVAYLKDVLDRGIEPLALRYFFLQAHYRTPMSFSWEALEGAASALERLRALAAEVKRESRGKRAPSSATTRFLAYVREDLSTPAALGDLWESVKSDEYAPEEKYELLETAEANLGLSLFASPAHDKTAATTPEVQQLLAARQAAREAKDYQEADRLRDEILKRGYRVEDRPEGPQAVKRKARQ